MHSNSATPLNADIIFIVIVFDVYFSLKHTNLFISSSLITGVIQ